jgi:hypothetical protein
MAAHHDRVFTSRNSNSLELSPGPGAQGYKSLGMQFNPAVYPAFHSKAGDYIGLIKPVQPRKRIIEKKQANIGHADAGHQAMSGRPAMGPARMEFVIRSQILDIC